MTNNVGASPSRPNVNHKIGQGDPAPTWKNYV